MWQTTLENVMEKRHDEKLKSSGTLQILNHLSPHKSEDEQKWVNNEASEDCGVAHCVFILGCLKKCLEV